MNNYTNSLNNYNNNNNINKSIDKAGFYSLIAGIISIFTCAVYYIGFPCSICAIALSFISRNNTNGKFSTKAIIGLCMGIIGIIFTLLVFFAMLTVIQNPDLMNYIIENSGITNL